MQEVARLMEKLSARMGLPGSLAEEEPRILLTGSRQVLVEQYHELLSYSDDLVELSCRRHRLRIRGSDLLLRAMNQEELLITGTVLCVEVESA